MVDLFLGGFLLTFCCSVVAQTTTYSVLPAPSSYADGNFTNPDTANTQVFSQGSSMNVSWTTDYTNVNLYLIFGGNYNTPWTCTTGTTQSWWLWTVDDHGNNSQPFGFRAVNASGTLDQQMEGGFWTGRFWIDDDLVGTTSTTSTSSSTTQTRTTLTAATSLQTTASSTSIFSGGTTASTTPSAGPTSHSSNGTAIGIGVGVGAGIGIVAIAIGGFLLFWHRRKRQRVDEHPSTGLQKMDTYTNSPPTHAQPSELHDDGATARVEAPYGQLDPYELSGEGLRFELHSKSHPYH